MSHFTDSASFTFPNVAGNLATQSVQRNAQRTKLKTISKSSQLFDNYLILYITMT